MLTFRYIIIILNIKPCIKLSFIVAYIESIFITGYTRILYLTISGFDNCSYAIICFGFFFLGWGLLTLNLLCDISYFYNCSNIQTGRVQISVTPEELRALRVLNEDTFVPNIPFLIDVVAFQSVWVVRSTLITGGTAATCSCYCTFRTLIFVFPI